MVQLNFQDCPETVIFDTFHFETCFVPQRRAPFQRLNFQKWSGREVLLLFDFKMCFAPQQQESFDRAYFSTLRRPQDIGKTPCFRDFPTFSHICIFFLLTLSLLIFFLLIFLFSLPLPCSAFHLSILSEVWLLNFLRLPNIYIYIYIIHPNMIYRMYGASTIHEVGIVGIPMNQSVSSNDRGFPSTAQWILLFVNSRNDRR